MIRIIILSIALIGCTLKGYSQLPGTWTVNPASWNYSMTLTSYIDQNCVELSDPDNAVAAFAGTQCRGFAYTNVDGNGHKLAFVTIYSNSPANEAIQLRFFKASTGQEIAALDGFTFLSEAVKGTISQPFITTTNHRPTAISVSNLGVQENTASGGFIGTITGTDQDAGQTLLYSLTSGLDNSDFQVTGASLELNTVLDYAIQSSYQIAINVNDGQGCSFTDTFTVTVDDHAFPPVAVYDIASINEDDTLQISVLVNDSDYDNDIDTASLQIISTPSNGTFSVTDGIITYIPDQNFSGSDTLIYSICDLTNTGALCDTAIVYISVLAVQDAPVANQDTVSTPEETMVSISVLLNDTDIENDIDPASLQIISAPSNGTAVIVGSAIQYTPDPDFAGTDTLTYSICDLSTPAPVCDQAFVIIHVLPVADAPTAIIIDTLSVNENNETNTLISHIQTTDADLPDDNFIYTLVPGENDSDNSQFTIAGNMLMISTRTIYEIKSIYHIRVRSTDAFGLFVEKAFDIDVIDDPKNELALPASTYISTNADGKNDYFTVENVVIYNAFSLEVFDQFGKRVYFAPNNYGNDFDGKLNNEPLPSGAYYYIFKNEELTYKGTITIVN